MVILPEYLFIYLQIFAVILVAVLILLTVTHYFEKPQAKDYDELLELQKKELMPGYPVQFAEIENIKIRYLQTASAMDHLKRKPNLVLIHGIGASIYCWRKMLPQLTEHFKVTAFDLPGFGLSEKSPKISYNLDDQSRRVMALLDQLGIDKFYLVGHSMGGALSAWLAHKYPDRIEKLSLLAPAFGHKLIYFNPAHLHIRWSTAAIKNFVVTPQIVHWVYTRACVKKIPDDLDEVIKNSFLPYYNSPDAFVAIVKSNELLRDSRLSHKLKNLKQPTQVICGTNDRVISHAKIKSFLKSNPHAEMIEIKNSGHMIIEEDAPIVNTNLIRFFNNE